MTFLPPTMKTDLLVTCPRCRTPNFSAAGLSRHYCRVGGERRRLTQPEFEFAIQDAHQRQQLIHSLMAITRHQSDSEKTNFRKYLLTLSTDQLKQYIHDLKTQPSHSPSQI